MPKAKSTSNKIKTESKLVRELFIKNFIISVFGVINEKYIEEKIALNEFIKETPDSKNLILNIKNQPSDLNKTENTKKLPLPVLRKENTSEKKIQLPVLPLIRQAPHQKFQIVGTPSNASFSPGIKEIPGKTIQIPNLKPTLIEQDIKSLGLGKITALLLDPAVMSVECPGPEKPILVNKSGLIQASGMILSEEEIKIIMNEISKKTKIPLLSGVFKAALGNVLVTALVSEFLGTRFIVQKITPLTQ